MFLSSLLSVKVVLVVLCGLVCNLLLPALLIHLTFNTVWDVDSVTPLYSHVLLLLTVAICQLPFYIHEYDIMIWLCTRTAVRYAFSTVQLRLWIQSYFFLKFFIICQLDSSWVKVRLRMLCWAINGHGKANETKDVYFLRKQRSFIRL